MLMQEQINQKASSQAEHKNPVYTTEEVKQFNIPCNFALPEPKHCEYCGKILFFECIVFYGSVIAVNGSPQRCTCEEAVEYWKKVDEAAKLKKEQEKIAIEQNLWKRKVERSKISKRHQSCTLSNYNICLPAQKKACEQATFYVKNFSRLKSEGKGLYIEGTCGTGKTHLAAAISLELLKQGYSVIMQTPHSLLGDIKRAYDEYSDYTEDEILHKYKTIDLLVIDCY